MNEDLKRILDAREERWMKKRQLSKEGAVVCMTLRMPRELRVSEEGIAFFERMKQRFSAYAEGLSLAFKAEGSGADGPYCMWMAGHAHAAKHAAIAFEEEIPGGELLDIDVTSGSLSDLSRSDFGYPPRRCAVCGVNDARICAGNQKHDRVETVNVFARKMKQYM